jgi:hypothetical protein
MWACVCVRALALCPGVSATVSHRSRAVREPMRNLHATHTAREPWPLLNNRERRPEPGAGLESRPRSRASVTSTRIYVAAGKRTAHTVARPRPGAHALPWPYSCSRRGSCAAAPARTWRPPAELSDGSAQTCAIEPRCSASARNGAAWLAWLAAQSAVRHARASGRVGGRGHTCRASRLSTKELGEAERRADRESYLQSRAAARTCATRRGWTAHVGWAARAVGARPRARPRAAAAQATSGDRASECRSRPDEAASCPADQGTLRRSCGGEPSLDGCRRCPPAAAHRQRHLARSGRSAASGGRTREREVCKTEQPC